MLGGSCDFLSKWTVSAYCIFKRRIDFSILLQGGGHSLPRENRYERVFFFIYKRFANSARFLPSLRPIVGG